MLFCFHKFKLKVIDDDDLFLFTLVDPIYASTQTNTYIHAIHVFGYLKSKWHIEAYVYVAGYLCFYVIV